MLLKSLASEDREVSEHRNGREPGSQSGVPFTHARRPDATDRAWWLRLHRASIMNKPAGTVRPSPAILRRAKLINGRQQTPGLTHRRVLTWHAFHIARVARGVSNPHTFAGGNSSGFASRRDFCSPRGSQLWEIRIAGVPRRYSLRAFWPWQERSILRRGEVDRD